MILLILLSLMPLTACTTKPQVYPTDPHNECRLPDKPPQPMTGKDVGVFITQMGQRIKMCQALIGG